MTVLQMRNQLATKYHGVKTWKDKVNKMPDDQVVAVWCKMQQQIAAISISTADATPQYEQLTFGGLKDENKRV